MELFASSFWDGALISQIEVPQNIQVILLAFLQGVAEFLPISSSGHLVVFSELLGRFNAAGIEQLEVTELSIVLHAGTLLSIVLFYRKEIYSLLTTNKRLIPLIIVGTLPVVVVGLTIKYQFEWLQDDALLAGFMFVVTGFLLMTLAKLDEGKLDFADVSFKQVIVIGLFQAVAILPGISRSGSTIVGGCLMGLKRKSAATFSFLLAIPAILGATVLEAKDLYEKGSSTEPMLLGIGFLISFLVGLVSLTLLVRWLGKGKLHYFAYYVIPLGFSVVIWQIWEMISVSN